MKTSRQDIEKNKRKIFCENSTLIGYSSHTLKYGDLFLYWEYCTDGTKGKRLAKCHGQVRPLNKIDSTDKLQWFILTQAADHTMKFSYERWIEPKDVIEVIPKDRANKHILIFFEETEDYFG